MADLITVFVIALGLAADAFAVSICNSMTKSKLTKMQYFAYPICFGLFQGLMPLVGYYIGSVFSQWITVFDHWIALILLSIIGGKMIIENVKAIKSGKANTEENLSQNFNFAEMIVQGFSTSIDAMVVGVTLALTVALNIYLSVFIIAVITFLLSLVGMYFGRKLGKIFSGYAGVAGGIILIGIGLKIFIEHTILQIGAI